MTTIKEYYDRANALWPADMPPLTFPEAVRAARKLYRYALGRKCQWKFKEVHGRLNTWVWNGTMNINVAGDAIHPGWKDLVHSLAHLAHNRMPDHDKPHSKEHARLEIRLVKQVLKRGWLQGTLKDKPKTAAPMTPAAPVADLKLAQIEAAEKRWTTKLKRAQNALRKLNRRRKYYERKAA